MKRVLRRLKAAWLYVFADVRKEAARPVQAHRPRQGEPSVSYEKGSSPTVRAEPGDAQSPEGDDGE